MLNSSILIQLRRTQFSACLVSSLKLSTTLEYTQRHLPLSLPHLRLWTHPPPPHPLPTAPAAVPVTLAAGAAVGGSAQKKKKAVEHSGTSCDTLCACANPPSLSPPAPHDMWARITCTTCQWVLHVDLSFKGLATVAALSTCPMAPPANLLWSWLS